MSQFKVGDLVECVNNDDKELSLSLWKKYLVDEICGDLIATTNDLNLKEAYSKKRFKLAEPELKPFDRVTIKNLNREFTIFEIAQTMAIVVDQLGSYFAVNLNEILKVEEKKAPPKFTKIYVWDLDKRPKNPRMAYSFGEIRNGRLACFTGGEGVFLDFYIENWEVIG